MENHERLKRLEGCQWACRVGAQDALAQTFGTVERIAARMENDPDAFMSGPYQDPYEAMCVRDHEQAACVAGQVDQNRVARIAQAAYLSTWKVIPVAEICGLVSDDAQTLATLLLAQTELAPFSQERLDWYLAGRIPFGYEGAYPNGRWRIL